MKTLNAPVYEVKQDSNWYKSKIKQEEDQKKFFKEVNDKYFTYNGFSYYTSESFGVHGSSEDYDKYKDELVKNPDKNGIHTFKKRSKYFSILSGMINKITRVSPFQTHDTFGLNNARASQWIGDRWFFEVKSEEPVKSDDVELVNYKDYLELYMSEMNNK